MSAGLSFVKEFQKLGTRFSMHRIPYALVKTIEEGAKNEGSLSISPCDGFTKDTLNQLRNALYNNFDISLMKIRPLRFVVVVSEHLATAVLCMASIHASSCVINKSI